MRRRTINLAKAIVLNATRLSGYRQSEQTIIRQAKQFWDKTGSGKFQAYSHWRGADGVDALTWDELGRQNLNFVQRFTAKDQSELSFNQIVDWGCGGGANAVHFATLTRKYIGVEVSQASLDECRKTLAERELHHFSPVLIDVANPESALEKVTESSDLFLCTYVMELVPTPEYGQRIVEIAYRLLRPGGFAMIQIKYSTDSPNTRPRRWGYHMNAANMTTYSIDSFWQITQAVGFDPIFVILQPIQELVGDQRYAYFWLQRPES